MALPFIRRFTKRIFIACNFVIGIFFLGGAFVKYFDPESYWYLGLLTLALPYFIVALVIFFFFWLFVKPFWCIVSVIFIAIGWNAVINVIPMRVDSYFTMDKDSTSIRIMSWNVEQFNIQNYKKNPGGKQKMLDLINEYDPDIACLQEVVAGSNPLAINYFPAIVKELDFNDNFFAYQLANNFDRYHHFGTIIFSKYPVIRKQFMINSPDDYNSTFQFIDVLIGKDTVRIFNVHLQSLKFSKENREYLDSIQVKKPSTTESKSVLAKIRTGAIKRGIQARFVKDAMDHSPYPKILCGDFNDVPVSYAYETIARGMQNAFVEKGSGLSRTFDGIAPTLRIDNIFVDSNFTVTQYRRIKRSLSDHFPIVADIKLNMKKGKE